MAKRKYPLGMGLIRAYPAGAGLLVVVTTVLGWLGCDSISQVADQTAALLNAVPNANGTIFSPTGSPYAQSGAPYGSGSPYQQTGSPYAQPGSPWGATIQAPAVVQNTGYQSPYGYAPAPAAAQPTGVQPNYTGTTGAAAPQSAPTISIGSFNIQVFGVDKLSDQAVMSYLVDVVRKFDILAIQELRSTDDTIIPRFVQMINQGGQFQYGYVVGPREGYTTSKEQYVFLYNEQKLERVDQGMVVPHPNRALHRDPLCATFRCRTADPRYGFSFTLMNIQTDPDMVPTEVNALADVWQLAHQSFPYEDDFILLGDFNASPRQFGRLGQIPNIYCAISPEMPTNTAGTQCYDNLVFDRLATSEFQGQFGVFDLASYYRITKAQAQLISDHQPVWALFSAFEKPPASVASQPFGLR